MAQRVQDSAPQVPEGSATTATILPKADPGASTAALQKLQADAQARQAQAQKSLADAQAAMAKNLEDARNARQVFGDGKDAKGMEGAKKYLDDALKADPNNLAARRMRALNDYKQGDCAGASADAALILKDNPEDKKAFGISQLCGGGLAMSLSAKAPAPAPDPGSAAALGGAVPVMISPAAVSNPASSASFLEAGLKFMALGNYDRAIEAATDAIKQDPTNVQAWLMRATALKKKGNYAQALSDMNQALQYNPNSLELLNSKANIQNHLKDYKGALETAERALSLNPTSATAYANKAFALGGMGDRQGMLAALKTAASLDPQFQAALDAALDPASDTAALLLGGDGKAAGGAKGRASPVARSLRRAAIALVAMLVLGAGAFVIGRRRETLTMSAPPASSAASTPPPPASSGLLQGKYQVGQQIGAGGMGMVFEGKDLSLERKIAVKRMLPQLASQPSLRERFISEAKIVAALHHPNIVDIHAIIEEGQDVFLIFEYIAGRTLHDIIAARRRLPFAEAARIIRDVGAALDFAHGKGIIHRDLKPANVMIDERGLVKVMDFGLARAAQDLMTQAAMTGTVAGTPAYMAPEQENGVVCRQSDVFSLAVCLYEALAGRRPFDGAPGTMSVAKVGKAYTPVSKLASGLPEGIDALLARALAPDPKERISSPQEFIVALEALGPPSAAPLTRP